MDCTECGKPMKRDAKASDSTRDVYICLWGNCEATQTFLLEETATLAKYKAVIEQMQTQRFAYKRDYVGLQKRLDEVEAERDELDRILRKTLWSEQKRIEFALTPPQPSPSGRTPESGVSGGVEFNEA